MSMVLEVRIPSCCAETVCAFAWQQETAIPLVVPWLIMAGLYAYLDGRLTGLEMPQDIQELCDRNTAMMARIKRLYFEEVQ